MYEYVFKENFNIFQQGMIASSQKIGIFYFHHPILKYLARLTDKTFLVDFLTKTTVFINIGSFQIPKSTLKMGPNLVSSTSFYFKRYLRILETLHFYVKVYWILYLQT